MQKIEENELESITGGISGWSVVGIGALAALIIGVLNGIVHPSKCN